MRGFHKHPTKKTPSYEAHKEARKCCLSCCLFGALGGAAGGWRCRLCWDEGRDDTLLQLAVSQKRGPQYRPQNTIVLIMGTPKRVPLILGNPQLDQEPHTKSLLKGRRPDGDVCGVFAVIPCECGAGGFYMERF